jgi:hypothetical protein
VGVEGGCGGAVVVIQRFGDPLNLHVHCHALVSACGPASKRSETSRLAWGWGPAPLSEDGVFAGEPGKLAFHRVRHLTALDAE